MPKPFHLAAVLLFAAVARAQTVVTAPPETAKLRLTVGQGGQTLVADRRAVELGAGQSLLRFPGVAAQLDDNSVQPIVTGQAPARVLEQHFSYDVLSSNDLLRRFSGETVKLLRPDNKVVSGTLMVARNFVLLESAEGTLLNPTGTYALPRRVEGITATPTLEWLMEVEGAGAREVEARYSTGGLSWTANYNASLNAAADRLDLRAWLSVANKSGADFRGAQLALKIGKLDGDGVLLQFPRAVDLPDEHERQLSYAAITSLPVARELVFYAAQSEPDFFKSFSGPAQQTVRLVNSSASGLGLILPAGQLSVWGENENGAPRLLAKGQLPFTAPDERFSIALGPEPKVTGARSQTATRQLNPQTTEHTFQIALTNKRASPVTVSVIEKLPAGAKISESSVPPIVLEPNLVEFKAEVPANGAASVKYVVELKRAEG